ncbi:uncharacterized protein NECHADRAFT_85459 [Fusarium vanettenii 77-13-4]|uniref:Mid2 domain-containing protein n=1 Tax=Fusarium vanettenii (strain ATCC MYA-4622 / CBS 123669 / FGSC 9596 / NRRL 45880 / 77-13-4) TaxID=660122 RepID=C7ZNP2_FUSV7|nr:uncharacterized protein NECHADRAFT_85459 [Fusarium vanettenii 77-13-4]EEU34024.1 predicted protein [Fusarium vanettenii 77-13-4]
MDSALSIRIYLVLAFQLWFSVAEPDLVIGYFVESGTITCPNSGTFNWSPQHSWANCEPLAPASNGWVVGKSCASLDSFDTEGVIVFLYATSFPDDISRLSYDKPSSFERCETDNACTTVTLYESYNGGEGESPHYLISCKNMIGMGSRDSFATLFLENPTTYETTIATETETDDTSSKPTEKSRPSTASPPTTTETEGTDDQDSGDELSAGVIAGIAVGSVAGVVLVVCAIIIAFRMGRKKGRQGDHETRSKSLADRLKSFPRPALVWRRPDATKGGTETSIEPKAELPASSEVQRPTDALPYTNAEAQSEARTRGSATELPA